jgi:hypothetical protein
MRFDNEPLISSLFFGMSDLTVLVQMETVNGLESSDYAN